MPRTSIATTKRWPRRRREPGSGKIGQTEEGRDQVVLAIADEASIQQLDKYKTALASLGDPRKTSDQPGARADQNRQNRFTGSTAVFTRLKRAGPEMLIELAYRLLVEETPFIQSIRNNVIVFITPVVEGGRPGTAGGHVITTARRPASSGRR